MNARSPSLKPAAALSRLGWIAAIILALSAVGQGSAEPFTFIVEEGSAPWHDRVGQWSLAAVPESLKGSGPIPQQSCSTRKLTVTGTPSSILVGVMNRDADGFKGANPGATDTGLTITITNGKGSTLPYLVMKLDNPTPVVAGGSAGGLLLLGVTDGAGKESGASATAPAPATEPPLPPTPGPEATPAERRTFATGDAGALHVYLLMGQSNMVGRDTSGLDAQTEDGRIGFIDRDGRWWIAREPMHDGGSGMGPGLSFAQEMVRMAPSIRIGLAPCAVGGSPLKRWEKGGDLYASALARAQAARKAGTLKGLLWHQGETDSNNASDASSYQDRLVKMLTDFREDLGLPNLPVVVGQLGDFVEAPKVRTVQNALVTMPGQLAHVAFADSTGLMDKGDHLHFNTAAARELGIRYALVMKTLQGDTR